MKKTYIGDAIYAEVEGYHQIKIYTSNGVIDHDPIYLDPETWTALKRYVKENTTWEK